MTEGELVKRLFGRTSGAVARIFGHEVIESRDLALSPC